MDCVFLRKMLKLCSGCAHIIVCSVVSTDFDRRNVSAVSVLGSLPNIECIPLGRAAWGSVVYLSDERLGWPQQSWICLLWSMNYAWLSRSEGRYPLSSSTELVGGLNVCREFSPLQLTQGKEESEQSLIQCLVRSVLSPLLLSS